MIRPVVAAVCYRRHNGKIEFLLVRTSGGSAWTFPKGHVETNEIQQPWAAAQREAREEAGATGIIEQECFASYAYSKGKHLREDAVDAYLLAVTSMQEPRETQRRPQWFSADDAKAKLSEGRSEKKYIDAHLRVVDAALARLKGA